MNGVSLLPFQKDYEELAENVMNIVDRLVHKTDVRTILGHIICINGNTFGIFIVIRKVP